MMRTSGGFREYVSIIETVDYINPTTSKYDMVADKCRT